MHFSAATLFRGIGWITGMFLLANAFRFFTSLYLTRILTPELMGAMLIIFTIRNAIELFSDVGIGQNVVASKHGDDPIFRNTAWLIQCLRGLMLGFLMFITAPYIAEMYSVPASAIALASLSLVAIGLSSTSLYVLQRKIRVAYVSVFEVAHEIFGSVLVIIAATISPTLWSLVFANLAAVVIKAISTYFLPNERGPFSTSLSYAKEIFHFGKWIFLTSLLILFCMNFDRLYFGQAVPLAVLGVYGLARSIGEIPSNLAGRICHSLVFPTIASVSSKPRQEIHENLAKPRQQLLLLSAVVMGIGIAVSDVFIEVMYDSRYHDAGMMLPILLVGVWFGIIANINDYALLGVRRPVYGVVGNILKATHLVITLPLALSMGGFPFAIAAFATADLSRFAPLAVGLVRERLSFFRQDAIATLTVAATAVTLLLLRYWLGFGAGVLDLLLQGAT